MLEVFHTGPSSKKREAASGRKWESGELLTPKFVCARGEPRGEPSVYVGIGRSTATNLQRCALGLFILFFLEESYSYLPQIRDLSQKRM